MKKLILILALISIGEIQSISPEDAFFTTREIWEAKILNRTFCSICRKIISKENAFRKEENAYCRTCALLIGESK